MEIIYYPEQIFCTDMVDEGDEFSIEFEDGDRHVEIRVTKEHMLKFKIQLNNIVK